MPAVTVLMTVYNGMPYLPLAIESILQQSFSDFELLIVNDCSTDRSRDVILSYQDPRIRLVDNPENIKQTRSLNRGLELAQSEWIARMDADDISHPQRLAKQVAFLQAHPEVVAVGCNIRYIDPKGKVINGWRRPEHNVALRWLQFFACPISCGAVMFRKSIIWEQLGGFDSTINYPQDWELWSRIPPEVQLANLPDFLLDVRIHPQAATIAARPDIVLEQTRICRANPARIVGITDQSEAWFHKVDHLIAEPVEQPADLIEVLQVLFPRFCALYPTASQDTAVIQELAKQCARACIRLDLPDLRQVFQQLSTQLIASLQPELRLQFYRTLILQVSRYHLTQLAYTVANQSGLLPTKRWLQRRFQRAV